MNAGKLVQMHRSIRFFMLSISLGIAASLLAAIIPRRQKAISRFAISNFNLAKHCRSCASIIGHWEHRRKMRRAKRPMPF